MTLLKTVLVQGTRWAGRAGVFLGFAAGVVLLMLWLAGRFEPKVPATVSTTEAQAEAAGLRVEPVRLIRLPHVESAVGSIRAVHETSIGSKLLARVVEVNLKAGQKVRQGDVLVQLDDRDLRAKRQQADAAVGTAEATLAQASADEKRYAELVKTNTISRQQYEKSATARQSAEMELRRAKEVAKEVQAMLEWATIRASIGGTIIDKKIDVGDMVTPGQVLLTLFDPQRMQLVASVRESLAQQLQVDQGIDVRIDGMGKQCRGTISEIVPEAQSASRTFQVKVTGPCPPGIYAGMFGRILIPLEEELVPVIPQRAIRSVGQLELVEVVQNGRPSRRAIRTGRRLGDDVEVLSGLRKGEQVVIPSEPATQEARHD